MYDPSWTGDPRSNLRFIRPSPVVGVESRPCFPPQTRSPRFTGSAADEPRVLPRPPGARVLSRDSGHLSGSIPQRILSFGPLLAPPARPRGWPPTWTPPMRDDHPCTVRADEPDHPDIWGLQLALSTALVASPDGRDLAEPNRCASSTERPSRPAAVDLRTSRCCACPTPGRDPCRSRCSRRCCSPTNKLCNRREIHRGCARSGSARSH